MRRFWLGVYCWTFFPVSTFRFWRITRGMEQHFIGWVNGRPTVALTSKVSAASQPEAGREKPCLARTEAILHKEGLL